MKIAGIICEYNPFHNGHAYQLALAKNIADAAVCIMSGSFVQRGEAAVYDKWTRAHAALLNGADLVLELPVRYCLSSAQGFARGAVESLNSTGVIDSLIFGSEIGNIHELSHAAELIANEPSEVSEKIKNLMARGMGYAAARTEAYRGIIDANLLSEPNNLLALEYLCALKATNSKITPITHTRTTGYHSAVPENEFASATLLRKKINAGESISLYTPFDFSDCEKYDTEKLTEIFRYRIITEGEKLFSLIPDAEAGIENRFIKSADIETFDGIVDFVSGKRYTRARVRRIMLSALLNIRGGYRTPEYIRILGMNETGMKILSQMREKSTLPVVNKTADFSSPMIFEDIRATNISVLCADRPIRQNRDFFTSPIIVKNT